MARSGKNPDGIVIGEKLGRYKVVSHLGRGAMGEVYLCHDDALNRDVAVKVLADTHRKNPELRARFVREARAVARVAHPNIVHIHLIDEHSGLPYFAMDYLKGRDLGSLLREFGPMDPGEAVAIILRVARGLRAAAKAGVVHRDLKPANIVVASDGDVKLMDFGLAKTISVDPELTAAGLVVGTPDYISPEQARGEQADSRSDIYGLGCTLFHLLSGQPPFRVKDSPNTYMAILGRHMHRPPPSVEEFRPGIDSGLASLCLRMMEKDPNRRPDIENVIEELSALEKRFGAVVPKVVPRPLRRVDVIKGGVGVGGGVGDGLDEKDPGQRADGGARRGVEDGLGDGGFGLGDGGLDDLGEGGDGFVGNERLGRARRWEVNSGGEEGYEDDDVDSTLETRLNQHTLVARTGLPGWALVVTALAVAVFLIGLGLRLSRTGGGGGSNLGYEVEEKPNKGKGSGSGENRGGAHEIGQRKGGEDGENGEEDEEGRRRLGPGIPWNTVLIATGDGQPDLHVSVRPVSLLQWTRGSEGAKSTPVKKGDTDPRALLPVAGVRYEKAAKFAERHGGRLPSLDEWQKIRRADGVLFPDHTMWEWVDTEERKPGKRRAWVANRAGKRESRRTYRKYRDVTFRIVWDADKAQQ